MAGWKEKLKEYRRLFHRHPETGWLTFFASCFLAEHLKAAGYEVFVGKEVLGEEKLMDEPTEDRIAAQENLALNLAAEYGLKDAGYWISRMGHRTGVVAVFDTGKSGPVQAFRFDMDALTVAESDDGNRVPVREHFSSEYLGISHACGHDGHTAIGLALAERLFQDKEILTGKYLFIFQPAEEGARGAIPMCKQWRFGKIDRLFCCHIGFAPEDTFVAGAKGFLATSKFNVEFFGKSAHAGLAPERGRNAILAAAESIVAMQVFERPANGLTRLNVGVIEGGEARNTIPAYVRMKMETRGSTTEYNEYMKERALACIAQASDKYGVSYKTELKGECVSAESDEELSALAMNVAKRAGGFSDYLSTWNFGASDDATIFMEMVQRQGGQAVYMLFGTKTTGLHHETVFDFSEDVLEAALNVLHETAVDRSGSI